jgi:alkylation response protein AidB-like acyl-CoA dehydrogenase
MSLLPDPDQIALRASVRGFLDEHSTSRHVRAVIDADDGYDRPLWNRLATELDLAGLTVPEQYGGSGAGYATRAVVLEDLGAHLTPSPFFSSCVLAVDTLTALDDEEARAKLLPAIARGEAVVTVAHGGTATARREGTQWTVRRA